MHSQSHALSLLLPDFSKPFLYVSHYFNRASTERFCLCKTHGQLLLISSRPCRDFRASQKKWGLFSQGSISLYYRYQTPVLSLFHHERLCLETTQFPSRDWNCLRAEKLFMRTATLLVPETLIWVVGNRSTHLGCPNSAVTKVKTWLTQQEN